MMKEPVVSKYGHHFEKQYIINWINENGTCPITRKPLCEEDIEDDEDLEQEI